MNAVPIQGWLTSSPSAWKVDRLKDCFSEIVGGDWGDDLDSDTEGQDLVVLRVADFDNGTVSRDDLTIRRIKNSKIQHRLLSESSLLVEKSGGGENQWVGRVVLPGHLPFKAICSNFIAKLEVIPQYFPAFLNYVFAALYDAYVNRPHVRQTTGIQNLALHHYLSVKVALPSLDEQKLIAAYLDACCEAIGKAVATKQQQLETLDALRKSIIQKAVTQGLNSQFELKDSGVNWLGPIPRHWRVQKLKRVFANVAYGISESTEQNGNYAVLKMGNIVKGEIAFTKIEYVSEVDQGLVLDTNDLLFNRKRSPVPVGYLAAWS